MNYVIIEIIAKAGGVLTILGLTIGFFFRTYIQERISSHFAKRIAEGTRITGVLTRQRLKWGEEIQDLIGSFCGAAHCLRFSTSVGSDEERKKIEEINRLQHRIPLNLCEQTELEIYIEECVKTVASMSIERSTVTDENFNAKLDELIHKTQELLHENWTTIEKEAKEGVYYPRSGEMIKSPERGTPKSAINAGA